jgi:hypothetical protein
MVGETWPKLLEQTRKQPSLPRKYTLLARTMKSPPIIDHILIIVLLKSAVLYTCLNVRCS